MSQVRVQQLCAAVIDGRTENVRYRQNELFKLHETLITSSRDILSAISADTNVTSVDANFECEAEYYLCMNAVEQLYSSLNFERALKQEYLVANGADNKERRIGKGLVLIRPTTHTRFYSTMVPIATAIAAGNCICLELADTMLNVDRVLKNLLPKALDCDTFYLSTTSLQKISALESAFLVDQMTGSSVSTLNQLPSNQNRRAIVIIDRGADIEKAAKAIVTARFSFQGLSVYSPDLVVVNEFIKDEFIEACSRYAGKFLGLSSKVSRAQNNDELATKQAMKGAEERGEVSMFGSTNFKIVDVHTRSSQITTRKIRGYYLVVIKSTSLVDSLMFQRSDSDALALYVFADPPTAKFLAQQFNAGISYINHIPTHLLVGPAAPSSQLTTPSSHKYSVEMFSSPKPQFIAPPADDLLIVDRLLREFQNTTSQTACLQKMQSVAVNPLPKTGQPPGHALGFFEQGIFLGLGVFLTTVIPSLGYGLWMLKKMLL